MFVYKEEWHPKSLKAHFTRTSYPGHCSATIKSIRYLDTPFNISYQAKCNALDTWSIEGRSIVGGQILLTSSGMILPA